MQETITLPARLSVTQALNWILDRDPETLDEDPFEFNIYEYPLVRPECPTSHFLSLRLEGYRDANDIRPPLMYPSDAISALLDGLKSGHFQASFGNGEAIPAALLEDCKLEHGNDTTPYLTRIVSPEISEPIFIAAKQLAEDFSPFWYQGVEPMSLEPPASVPWNMLARAETGTSPDKLVSEFFLEARKELSPHDPPDGDVTAVRPDGTADAAAIELNKARQRLRDHFTYAADIVNAFHRAGLFAVYMEDDSGTFRIVPWKAFEIRPYPDAPEGMGRNFINWAGGVLQQPLDKKFEPFCSTLDHAAPASLLLMKTEAEKVIRLCKRIADGETVDDLIQSVLNPSRPVSMPETQPIPDIEPSDRMTLMDAMVFFGKRDTSLTDEEKHYEHVDIVGAKTLFPLLADGVLIAKGFNAELMLEVVPRDCWLTAGFEHMAECHLVGSMEEFEVGVSGCEYGGTLTIFDPDDRFRRATRPKWVNIHVHGLKAYLDNLNSAPPVPKAAPVDKSEPKKMHMGRNTEGEAAALTYLLGLMSGGSYPTQNREHYWADIMEKFGIGKRAARRVWDISVQTSKNQNWGKRGRRPNRN